jgi:hypothetical protein
MAAVPPPPPEGYPPPHGYAPVVADLVRIDGSTMTMTIAGRTGTVRHCV